MIIDFHTHTFPDKIAGSVIGQQLSRSRPFTDATNDGLRRSMEQAGIDLSILLPVMTNAGQVHKLNDLAARINERWQETGLLSFGGMHPDVENYKEALNHVTELGLKGIKIHPAYQGADFDDIRYLRIIDKASELGLIVLTHAGWDIGIPGHNYCDTKHIQRVMREVGPDRLVLAHMGGWQQWEQVLELLCGEPVFFDTAFCCGSFAYRPEIPEAVRYRPLTEDQMVTLIRAHGAGRILFGTDSPWSDQREQIDLIRALPLTGEEKEKILGENGAQLLGL